MMRFPLFCVVALLGAAVSAPAQFSIEGRIGRHDRGSVRLVVGGGDHDVRSHRGHAEPVRCLPVPRPVFHPAPCPPPRGHWETVCEQVLVPGYWQEQHVPPTYGWIRGHCGRLEWGMVDPGGCRQVWVPPRYEQQSRRVWVPC